MENLPAMQKMQVLFLGQEDPLEKGMATLFPVFLPGEFMDRGAWWTIVHGAGKSGTGLRN